MAKHHVNFKRGDLLVATGSLIDPNFQRTVVLLCEHVDEQGTYGLVVNRPAEAAREVLERVPYAEGRLFQGGPVQRNTMQVLHTVADKAEGAMEVLPGVWVGGDFEAIEEGLKLGFIQPEQCRFYLGYAGWGKGQLAREFESEAWILVPGTPELLLGTPPERLWAQAIREYGKRHPLYASFTENPNLN